MTQIHNFLNTFKIMIKNDEFIYIDSYLYKNILLKIFDDITQLSHIENHKFPIFKSFIKSHK